MPGEDFSGAVDRQLAVLKKGLLEECEKSQQALKEKNAELREEVAALRKQLSLPDLEDEAAEVEEDSDNNVNFEKGHGKLEVSPELSAVVKIGDTVVHAEFWSKNPSNPGHDGGLIPIEGADDPDPDARILSSHCWIINPTGNLKLSWDVLGIPVLAWDLITIPMQVFGIDDADIMIIMGWVTLIFWTIDMPVCFLTGFFDKEGELVMEWKRIIANYCRGMFFLDLLIIGADWASIILEAVAGSASGFLSNVSILRALRISRFARLMRLRKLKAKWQTVEDHIDSEWALVCVSLFTKVMSIVGVTHYVGCIFFFIGDNKIAGYDSWLDTPYFQYRHSTKAGCGNSDNYCTFAEAPWGYQYWTVLHWAITQFTPGGMHVQPQNIPERAFTIFCLLFGMVVFSAFIANVTQARMQLNKMMSKFEKDLWLLRKFCRQNEISRPLVVRMRRYIDLVLIPKFQNMSSKDVILLPQLSEHLREELTTELESRKLIVHPFFQELENNKAAITRICNTAIVNISVARGDVVFGPASAAKFMYIVTGGFLDYIPHSEHHGDQERLKKDRWIVEAALWTKWITQGQLQGDTESTAIAVEGSKFRATLAQNAMFMSYALAYAKTFLDKMNDAWEREGEVPSDLQEDYAKASHQSAKRPSMVLPGGAGDLLEGAGDLLQGAGDRLQKINITTEPAQSTTPECPPSVNFTRNDQSPEYPPSSGYSAQLGIYPDPQVTNSTPRSDKKVVAV